MRQQIAQIRKELVSIVNMVKARVETEKGQGVDAMAISKRNEAASTPDLKHSTKSKPTKTKAINGQSVAEKEKKILLLEELRNDASSCQKCPLGKMRTNLVFGAGNPAAKLMFVGEAPGRDEDLKGEPFVGRAGQLLTKIIEAIGMSRSDVYIANVLKCRPPENRNPLPEEIALCMPYLIKQIEIIQPKVLCALGTFAAQTLLSTQATVGALRGRFHDYNGIPLMVTFHPAYLLRSPSEKVKVWEDMKKVRDLILES